MYLEVVIVMISVAFDIIISMVIDKVTMKSEIVITFLYASQTDQFFKANDNEQIAKVHRETATNIILRMKSAFVLKPNLGN